MRCASFQRRSLLHACWVLPLSVNNQNQKKMPRACFKSWPFLVSKARRLGSRKGADKNHAWRWAVCVRGGICRPRRRWKKTMSVKLDGGSPLILRHSNEISARKSLAQEGRRSIPEHQHWAVHMPQYMAADAGKDRPLDGTQASVLRTSFSVCAYARVLIQGHQNSRRVGLGKYLDPRTARSQSCDSAASTNAFPGSPLQRHPKISPIRINKNKSQRHEPAFAVRVRFGQHLVRTAMHGTFASLHIVENLSKIAQPCAILARSRSFDGEAHPPPPSKVMLSFPAFFGDSGTLSSDSGLVRGFEPFLLPFPSNDILH